MKLADYFDLFAQVEDAFYWRSADHQTVLMGFGVASMSDTSDMTRLKEWQAEQTLPVFGGFSFDEEIPSNQTTLLSGFVAPKVVIDFKQQVILGDGNYLTELTDEMTSKQSLGLARVIVDETSDDNWVQRVQDVIDEMINDTTKQKTVLGAQKQLKLSSPLDEARLLLDLNEKQQTSYHVAFKRVRTLFVSATPERLVSVQDNVFSTAAVAGSTPRGRTDVEDEQLGDALIGDEKNRQEHALVVNEIVDRLSDIADVSWADVPIMLKTPQIQHLYTPISGQLKANRYILDVALALHPTPALGGVPRDWAMATIKDVESSPRGLFAAPLGVVWPNGEGEFVIGIRAMVLADKTATLFAGAGILAASNAEQEWAEINLKMTPMKELIKEQIND